MEEPAEVRVGRGQRLIEAVREDLELFGVAELEERIEVLQSEIARQSSPPEGISGEWSGLGHFERRFGLACGLH